MKKVLLILLCVAVFLGASWYSIYLLGKYMPLFLASLLNLLAFGAAVLLNQFVFPRFSERTCRILGLVAFVALSFIQFTVYPFVDLHEPGRGTDRDDALNQTSQLILMGKYPYLERTYIGGAITPLPGALLLALPFWIVFKSVVFQTALWLGLFFVTLKRNFGPRAVLTGITYLFCFAVSCHDFLTGGDLIVNGLYLAVLTELTRQTESSKSLIWAALLGIALSSRLPALAVLPILLLFGKASPKLRIGQCAIALLVALSITLPFYFWDPAHFSPLHTLLFPARRGLLDSFSMSIYLFLPLSICLFLEYSPVKARPIKSDSENISVHP